MKPLDFYRIGMKIASSADMEAEHRTAINRMYYGLHHDACCRYFRENPDASPLERGSRHRRLIERYGIDENDFSNEVSELLSMLSEVRNIADYELGSLMRYREWRIGSHEFMIMAMTISEELLEALEIYSPGEASDGCDCPTTYSVG